MIKITRFFYISAACIPLFAVAYFSGAVHTLMLAYSLAAVHEIFHLFAALLFSVRVKSIIIMPFGITMRLADSVIKSPAKETAIALAGPLANLIMLMASVVLEKIYMLNGVGLFMFKYLNAAMLLINLLPCMPLDGGRIFKAFLVPRVGYLNAVAIEMKTGKIIVAILALGGIILLILTKFNISLVMIAAFLAFSMVSGEKEKKYILMRELVHYKDKLKNRKYMQTRSIAARQDIKAGDLIRRFGYDSFYIVNVLDKKLSISAVVTEADIIEAIEKNGFKVKLADIERGRRI